MAGVVSTEQWSIREKLCLASSVIRSGDQNWVSVSRAIRPFGEPGRPPDWFSQKNCACQYSALLETVDTPKRKRSERGEVVDTPGDLIVHKMTKERIAELKAQLEEDKIRYRELQREIEQIRSGQMDDKLQSMWNDIQEQKRAAQEAEEAQRIKAELAKAAAAAAKSASKPTGFQLTNKRRPPVRNPSASSRTLSETSSVGENVEVEDTSLTSPILKVNEDLSLDDMMTKDDDNSASAFLTSIVAAKLQEDQNAATANLGEGIPTDGEAEEAAEKLLAATASDLVDLLSPYPEDSSSSQSIDESSLPTPEVTTPAPRVKEPLILKIEKGVVKTREPKIETNISKSEETEEVEIISVDDAENEQRPSPDPETTKHVELTKPRTDPGDEYIEPPSPEDTLSRDDGGIKIKRKAARGRPSASQRKSSRIRTLTATDEEDLSMPDTPIGRRTAGKDSTMGTIPSLIDEDSKDTHSEAGDSDMTDKPSESDRDELSTAAAGTLQSALFIDSLPSSPASVAQSEEDHAYKIWRKAIMLVWRAIASHKYANVFLHPVTEDIAPGYKSIVLRPMDLITIKKNIENGVIRTTDQFHRDMMLMFQNAIMYNNADQHVHQIATIMQGDVVKQIEEFVSTQLLVHQPDSTKMLRGRGKQGHVEEDRSRRSSTDTDTSGKKRRTRADEN